MSHKKQTGSLKPNNSKEPLNRKVLKSTDKEPKIQFALEDEVDFKEQLEEMKVIIMITIFHLDQQLIIR